MKKCHYGQTIITGRSDKKYCSNHCKSAAQYEARKRNEPTHHLIDRQLKKNRKILKAHNKSGTTSLRKKILTDQGFDPNFFTHYWRNKKGQIYLFCYEFGFLHKKINEKDKYILITWQPYMKASQ